MADTLPETPRWPEATPGPETAQRPAVRAAIGAITTTIASTVPVFLVGGLAVQISADLRLTPATVGLAVAVYFGATAVGSLPVGSLVERYGPARTARAGIALSAASMLAIAVAARSLWSLLVLLAAAATANSLGQLASNASLARAVPARRQGFVFGAKQSAIPASTLLAGLAVPTVALTLGWRWAFGFAAVLAAAALLLVPPGQPDPRPAVARRRSPAGAGLVLLGVAAALGAAAASAQSTFLVDSAVRHGISEGLAGLTLTLGGATCVAGRLVAGWLVDRLRTGHAVLISATQLVGAVGVAALALDHAGAGVFVAGVLLGFGIGWLWPGMLVFTVVQLRPRAPAAATSITQTGVYVGASLGPVGFGLLVNHSGYGVAWPAAAASMALAGAFVLIGTRLARRAPDE
jgi:MFS family permease